MARTVLLADDSVTAQNMGRRILIDAGYEVVTVNNGSAALKRIHENRPDLIVLDVYMPGYGGLEICQRLKESAETARIPILLTVGKMEPFKAEEAKRARADGHIIKPFEASELLAALTRLEDRIIPQAESSRARKAKPEKKTKAPRSAFDPAMSFDDAHSEKIAYLEQVRERHASSHQNDDPNETFATSAAGQSAPSTEKQNVPAPTMARPMSVNAAEMLRELPVVAEPVQPVQEEQLNFEESGNFSHTSAAEERAEGTANQNVELADERPTESAEIAAAERVASADEAPGAVQAATSPAETESRGTPVEVSGELSSLQPESFEQGESAGSAEQGTDTSDIPEPAPVVAKSRWVAENVAVSAEEAALELEREMQQTQAVATVDQSSQNQEESAVPAVQDLQESAAPQPASAPAEELAPVEPSETNGATFAAAASASGASSEAVASSPVSTSSLDAEPHAGSEAAAAWENWRNIRDSVMGAQTPVQLSEAVEQALPASAAETAAAHSSNGEHAQTSEPAPPQRGPEPQTDGDSDNADLSSIVDTMLAELKPKLMAEIAKKLKK